MFLLFTLSLGSLKTINFTKCTHLYNALLIAFLKIEVKIIYTPSTRMKIYRQVISMRKAINICLDTDYIKKVDEIKGLVSRSSYINEIIKEALIAKGILAGV